jgi:nucleotide-binding universal stress UspA family protein
VVLARLLVGDDGSAGAATARAWACALATAADAEVTVAHVSDRAGSRAVSSPGSGSGDVWGLAGNPAASLLAAADEIEADLVVVGRRGAGGFGALRLGSVAHQIAEHTTRPVAVVPRSREVPATGWPFAEIAVGHDGSPVGSGALLWVAEIAALSSAKVHLVHAVELGPAFAAAGSDAAYERSRARAIAEVEGAWTAPLRDAGVHYATVVEDAGPVGILLETARVHSVGLLVVGRRGPDSFPGMAMGSVAHRVLGFAACPVVVVPLTPVPGRSPG